MFQTERGRIYKYEICKKEMLSNIYKQNLKSKCSNSGDNVCDTSDSECG